VPVHGVDGVVSVLVAASRPFGRSSIGTDYRRGRTLVRDEGVWTMIFLVVLVAAIVVIALVMRAAANPGGPGGGLRGPRPPRGPRPQRPTRPLAPDDDPEFLRELERRARRDDGRPT
jgi:hypothetical protein